MTMSAGSGKIVVQVELTTGQEEYLRNKEIVVKSGGKLPAFLANQVLVAKKKRLATPSDADDPVEQKRKKLVQSQSSQTSPSKQEGPSQGYWKMLAEKRRVALGESLEENLQLYDKMNDLEVELYTSKQMLQEARYLVKVLTKMLQEGEADKEEAAAAMAAANPVDYSGVVAELSSDAEDEL